MGVTVGKTDMAYLRPENIAKKVRPEEITVKVVRDPTSLYGVLRTGQHGKRAWNCILSLTVGRITKIVMIYCNWSPSPVIFNHRHHSLNISHFQDPSGQRNVCLISMHGQSRFRMTPHLPREPSVAPAQSSSARGHGRVRLSQLIQ